MFNWIKRKIKFTQNKKPELGIPDKKVSANLQDNVKYMKQLFEENSDFVFRSFSIGKNQEVNAFFVAVDGMYDKTTVNENVIKPLMRLNFENRKKSNLLSYVKTSLISIGSIDETTSMEKAIGQLLKGEPLLFINGVKTVYILGARAWEMRSISEPVTETVVRGPREGFVETLRTNTVMLRRKIHHPQLQIQQMSLGEKSQTEVAIAYIDGIVAPDILQEVQKRLKRINIDGILESGYIEELIDDAPYSPFPTIGNTERPDIVAARLLEGRVAIFVEGTPTVLVVPRLMMESFQVPEDYYSRPYYSTFLRLIRLLGFLVSTLTPAVYVAAESFHTEMFPTELLISIASAREGVPFPLSVEVFIMLLVFQWLREAGIRLPRPVGQAVSIVGALVLGEAAVNAGFIAAPTVIVIGISAITSFVVTPLAAANTLVQFTYLFAATLFGLYGVILALVTFLLHIASLRSFGIPYTSPGFPITWRDWKDLFVRVPIWAFDRRPEALRATDEIRQADRQKPHPPEKQDKERQKK